MRTVRRIVLVLAAVMVGLVGPAGARADGVLGGLVSAPSAPATPPAPPPPTVPAVVQTVTQPPLTTVPTVVQTVTQPPLPTVPAVVQAATQPVQTLPPTPAQTVGTATQVAQAVTQPVQTALADTVQTAVQPVAPLVQPLKPVTGPVTTVVAGVVKSVSTIAPTVTQAGPTAGPISPPKLTPVVPSRPHASGGGATQERREPVAASRVGGAAATPSEAGSVDRLNNDVGKQAAILRPRHSGGPLASTHLDLSAPRTPTARGATPRVRVGPVPDPWLAVVRPTAAPALDAGSPAQPHRSSLLGLTIDRSDSSAAIRFGFLLLAACLLAVGAAPTRAASLFGRWPSLAFDVYRPYALGSGFALLLGVAITGL